MSVTDLRDPLGARMKGYEKAHRTALPERSWHIIRLDGKSFSRWTKGLQRPYDVGLIDAMAAAAQAVCEEVSGSVLAYTQSDEITVVFTDRTGPDTQPWFGGQVQKIVSVAASVATATFARFYPDRPVAVFDARVFSLPSAEECANAVKWRADDCSRNAISMLASDRFSAKQLHGVGTGDRRRMLADSGFDVASCDPRFLHGQLTVRASRTEPVTYTDRRTGETCTSAPVTRRFWQTTAAPGLNADPDGTLMQLLTAAEGRRGNVG